VYRILLGKVKTREKGNKDRNGGRKKSKEGVKKLKTCTA
jgi:hypothetical protein